MTARDPIRPEMLSFRPNAIAQVAVARLGDPTVIPLWFGETDLVTPAFIRDAAKQALDDGQTFYVTPGGLPRFKTAIQNFTTRWYGVTPELDRIWVPGAAMLCILTALQTCVQKGEEVVVLGPMWPNISQAVEAVGGTPRYVRLDHDAAKGEWSLDLGKIEAAIGPQTKALFIGSPGNPTGWVISDEEIEAVLEISRRKGVAVISDEVYSVLYYEAKRAPSFVTHASEDDNVFIINSFSKAWAMTGWRMGWLVAPKRLAPAMAQLSVSNNTGTTVFAQYGGIAALDHGDAFIAEMVERCRRGRDIVGDFVRGQNRLNWVEPKGAFYAYVHVEGLKDSIGFAKNMLATTGVGVAPGAAFTCGTDADESYLRLCFAQDPKRLSEALDRMGSALRA